MFWKCQRPDDGKTVVFVAFPLGASLPSPTWRGWGNRGGSTRFPVVALLVGHLVSRLTAKCGCGFGRAHFLWGRLVGGLVVVERVGSCGLPAGANAPELPEGVPAQAKAKAVWFSAGDMPTHAVFKTLWGVRFLALGRPAPTGGGEPI